MYIAGEIIGSQFLIWGRGKNKAEALKDGAKNSTEYHKEKISPKDLRIVV